MSAKHDFSISMLHANVAAILIMIPTAILQFSLFHALHGAKNMDFTIRLQDLVLFLVFLVVSIVVHEFIHGLTWVVFGSKTFAAVKFDMQWKTLTPYAHLKEPIEVNLYRLGGFMPGFILGILFFIASIILGNSYLLWFSIIQTAAASGDWLILWILRNVKSGTLVEDHPSRAGCYVYEH
jgi:hypothetical protein